MADSKKASSALVERRNSRALLPTLIEDPLERAKAEATNGLLQYDQGISLAQTALEVVANGNRWKLRPSMILGLQRRALDGISSFAGTYRPGPVEIDKSSHVPPDAHLVPELVEDLCDYVNNNWNRKLAIHLSAYVLWRLNWIHPFDDGNGRTSRVVSYLVLLVKANNILAGSPTIPDLITHHRSDYFSALDEADDYWRKGTLNIVQAEQFLSGMLAKQLSTVYEAVGGSVPQDTPI